jgi:hypothetical protein
LIYMLMLLIGISASKNMILYIYLPELIPENYRVYVSSYGYTIDALLPIVIAINYFSFIGNEWETLCIVPLIFSVVFVICAFFIPESPKYLYARRMYSELRKTLDYISWINQSKMPENYDIDTECEETLKADHKEEKGNLKLI